MDGMAWRAKKFGPVALCPLNFFNGTYGIANFYNGTEGKVFPVCHYKYLQLPL